jgi:hypothetical protein
LECEYEGKWNDCHVMKPIMEKLYEHKFKKRRDTN